MAVALGTRFAQSASPCRCTASDPPQTCGPSAAPQCHQFSPDPCSCDVWPFHISSPNPGICLSSRCRSVTMHQFLPLRLAPWPSRQEGQAHSQCKEGVHTPILVHLSCLHLLPCQSPLPAGPAYRRRCHDAQPHDAAGSDQVRLQRNWCLHACCRLREPVPACLKHCAELLSASDQQNTLASHHA